MDRFEYLVMTWPAPPDPLYSIDDLNGLGADGWEAVGMTSRPTSVPMPGMGASVSVELVVLLKRPLASAPTSGSRRRQLRADERSAPE